MKFKRHYAKWLMITLIMAIGIGTFAALTISNEKVKETEEAKSSTYLTNQRQKDIDMKELKMLLGDYSSDDNSSLRLFIIDDYKDKGPYFCVDDKGAGSLGFEGRIMYLKDGIVIVEIDKELFKDMPEGWATEGDGRYAILDYEPEDDEIELGYRGRDIRFVKGQ